MALFKLAVGPRPDGGVCGGVIVAFEIMMEHLRRRRKTNFESKVTFLPGDIVTWKDGMQNRAVPDNNTIPGIVINNFYPAIVDRAEDAGSAYFNEILDIEVGFITRDDEFIVYALDSRRFKLYEV